MTITYRLHDGRMWRYTDVPPYTLADLGDALAGRGHALIVLAGHPGDCLNSADDSVTIRADQIASIEVQP